MTIGLGATALHGMKVAPIGLPAAHATYTVCISGASPKITVTKRLPNHGTRPR